MAKLDSKRRSHVRTVSDWPRGTRKRGVGFLHDQVWMPCTVEQANQAMREELPNEQIMEWKGVWHLLYLDRKMFWHPLGTFRLHTFYMGDDDGAPHDHPWWFITFPFRSYTETVMSVDPRSIDPSIPPRFVMNSRLVRAWRFHFRRAGHRHFVHEPFRPFKTLVMTGRVKNNWSFYPSGRRVRHREWTNYDRSIEG